MRRGNKCNRNCTAGGTSRASTPSYGKNMDAVFTIDKGTLESAIAIPRYILNRHFPDTRTHCYTNATCTPGSDSSHIVRANYQTLSSRAQPIEATNNCPDTGRNNMGTEDHDRSISPRVFVEYFYLPWNYRRNGVFHNERRSNDWDYAIDRWAMQDARLS